MRKIILLIVITLISLILANSVYAAKDHEYTEALKYYNSKKYQKAAELFKLYIRTNPDPAAYYRLGYSLYKIGKHDEAKEYFREAYLISPTFSPELPEASKKYQQKRLKQAVKPSGEQISSEQKPLVSEVKQAKTEIKSDIKQGPAAAKQPQKEIQPQTSQAPATTPLKEVAVPDSQKVEPEKTAPPAQMPPVQMPPVQMPMKDIPIAPAGAIMALVAGFMMIFIIFGIVLYLYFDLCLFLIAKKLEIPAPWTAWIPIIQTWTWVTCAGKPWWWILLIFVPFVNIIVGIYLWMCITENLGKNKWLGLLMLVPIVNLVFLGMLAFSKGERPGGSIEDSTMA